VYPRLEGRDTILTMPRVDSTFAFGSVRPANCRVFVNGTVARIWENGAFLVFAPLDTISNRFEVLAVSPAGDSLRKYLDFHLMPAQSSTAAIEGDHLNNGGLPARISIIEPYAHLRAIPHGAYVMAPPEGSAALADSFVAPYYRVCLEQNRHAWIEAGEVRVDTSNHTSPRSAVGRIVVSRDGEWSSIQIPLAEPLLFDLRAEPENRRILLDLFGARSRINRIDYDPPDPLIREIRWMQVKDDVLRLEILLNPDRLWGYGAAWGGQDGKTLILKIRRAPQVERRVLKHRRIVLDPGHGGSQPGSIGPTRLAEKEPNLILAQKLKALLEKEGAHVFLTRDRDTTMDLYDRVDYALQQDGENPFAQRGSAVYYYHPQSLELARVLHENLLRATGLSDHGLYYQNLALARPTEMLAVLLECAFMIHPEEEALLRDDRFLQRTAQGIVAGLKEFLKACRDTRESFQELKIESMERNPSQPK
jgi:N-acetylmuramoyl-L-alanine amidase